MRKINEKLFIAGWDHYEGEEHFTEMRLGQPVTLVRDPENKYDPNAIAVYWGPNEEGQRVKIGFVPKTSNGALAVLMDEGRKVEANISAREVSSNPWKRLAIDIEVM